VPPQRGGVIFRKNDTSVINQHYSVVPSYLPKRLDKHYKSLVFTTGADQLVTDAKPTVHPHSHGWYTRQTFVTCDYLSRGRNGSLAQTGRPAGRPATVHFPATDRRQLNCSPSESPRVPTHGTIQMWSPE